jgi:hypothetical protein
MKSLTLIAVLLFLSCAYSVPVEAQGRHLTVVCDDCRDPRRNPRDYRNFAYNQVFAPDAGMSYDEGDFFRLVNPDGQSVFVDMNMDIGLILVDVGLPVPLPIPTVIRIQVVLIYENGDQKAYMIDPRAHSSALPVGGRSGGRGGGQGGGRGGPGSGSSGPRAESLPPARTCGITRVDGGKARRTCI